MTDELKRELTLLDIFCLASGAMISSGIFILPGLAYDRAGPLVFVSYFLAGMLALAGTLSIIELATAMPRAGGDYFFITRSLGPLTGTISSFLSWTALCLKSAFAVFGIAEILYVLFGFPVLLSGGIITIFFVGLNILGVKQAARFEVGLVLGLFAVMLALIAGGAGKLIESNFFPLFPNGFNKMVATAGFVFISFGGLLNIASVSGEVQDPSRNIPRGMILSVITVTLIYSAILTVTVGVLPPERLTASLTPIADAGRAVFGQAGYVIVSIGALLAFITTANAGMISASRYPLALSLDKLLPPVFSRLTKSGGAPYVATGLTGLFIFACLFLDLTTLVKLGSVVILTLYILANAAVIILREGRIQNYRPAFRVPLYPWTNIGSILLFLLLIFDMGVVAVEISISVLVAAAAVYVFYGRTRHNIEYALLHLVERVINKRITDNTLEEELKQVIITRDDLNLDRIHGLIEDSIVLDPGGRIKAEELFNTIAEKVSEDIGLSRSEIVKLFKEREQEGTTAINPFVAIPHIIIPGNNRFKLVAARSVQGIEFSEENDNIKAVFVLFGTRDERAFHLKVLSAIAHIVQATRFEKAWLRARDEQQLKDIILLSERKRVKIK
ncbi:MAG: amino acid permease [Candidatus Omnitrophica bacterium]|nr:amino acid permease [Candidatus Omnitrophota bacterium]